MNVKIKIQKDRGRGLYNICSGLSAMAVVLCALPLQNPVVFCKLLVAYFVGCSLFESVKQPSAENLVVFIVQITNRDGG
jgi:hypothetical protein